MDRLEIWGVVGETTTPLEITAEKIIRVQIWDGGRFMAAMKGGVHDGKPVTSVQVRQAEVVFAYMERLDKRA